MISIAFPYIRESENSALAFVGASTAVESMGSLNPLRVTVEDSAGLWPALPVPMRALCAPPGLSG